MNEQQMIKEEQEFWDKEYPHLTRQILAVDDLKGTKYADYEAPDGNEDNIFSTLNSSREFPNHSFVWRYAREREK
mgnify:FL=1